MDITPEIARRMAKNAGWAVNSPFKDSETRKNIDTLIASAASDGSYWIDIDFYRINCSFPSESVAHYYSSLGFHVGQMHDHDFSQKRTYLRISW